MASLSRRRWSKELPLNLTELMNELISCAASFCKEFDDSEVRMRQIVEEMQTIAEYVKQEPQEQEEQEKAAKRRRDEAVARRKAAMSYSQTSRASGLFAAAHDFTASGDDFCDTVVALIPVSNTKLKESAKKVEILGKEFKEIVQPLKKYLEKIQSTCKELEQQSAKLQAEKTLTHMEDLRLIQQRVPALAEMTGEILGIVFTVFQALADMIMWIINLFTFSTTPEKDKKLRETIIQSADQYRTMVNMFGEMKKELRVFLE